MNFVETRKAWNLIDSCPLREAQKEEVPLRDSLGRVLAEDVFSAFDDPAFDKALKDGYAYKGTDICPKVVAVQRAGENLCKRYAQGECIKIMTGAVVPKEFDKLVMVEDAKVIDGKLKISGEVGNNICYQGEYLLKGTKILQKSKLLAPQDVAILASTGKKKVSVYCRPRVGILVTGDELVDKESDLKAGKKLDSNSPMLASQVRALGGEPREYKVVADTLEDTIAAISSALLDCDLVISSGGASMGDYDFIPKALQSLSAKFMFKKIKFKPGKPTFFSTVQDVPYFALPGNPVSSFVVFNLFVARLIRRMLHLEPQAKSFLLPMQAEFVRKKDLDRQEFRPCKIVEGKIVMSDFVNSGHLQALYGVDGLVEIPIGEKILPAKSLQNFYPL